MFEHGNENKEIKRGQVYFIKQSPQSIPVGSEMWADRYGVIVSNDVNNKYSSTVSVVFITTSSNKSARKKLPTHIHIRCTGKHAIACCEQVHPVDKSRLGDCVDFIHDAEMNDINNAIALQFKILNSAHPVSVFKKWEMYVERYNLENTFDDNESCRNKDEIIKALRHECNHYKSLLKCKDAQIEAMLNINR